MPLCTEIVPEATLKSLAHEGEWNFSRPDSLRCHIPIIPASSYRMILKSDMKKCQQPQRLRRTPTFCTAMKIRSSTYFSRSTTIKIPCQRQIRSRYCVRRRHLLIRLGLHQCQQPPHLFVCDQSSSVPTERYKLVSLFSRKTDFLWAPSDSCYYFGSGILIVVGRAF